MRRKGQPTLAAATVGCIVVAAQAGHTCGTLSGVAGGADGCSLREAIAASASDDEIVFSSLFDAPRIITLSDRSSSNSD